MARPLAAEPTGFGLVRSGDIASTISGKEHGHGPFPFLDDPREALRRQIAAAVETPIDAARAMHLDVAEHLAGIVRASGLPALENDQGNDGMIARPSGRQRLMARMRRIVGSHRS